MDYLSSDIQPPSEPEKLVCHVVPELEPYADILDVDFFTIVSECYVQHLYPCREAYGIPSEFLEAGKPLYSSAYDAYTLEVCTRVGAWCQERVEAVNNYPDPAKAASIFSTLPARLAYALKVGLFNDAVWGLELPTFAPVLCKFFVIDHCDYLAKYRYPIMEVFRMMEPLYCSVLIDSRRETEFKDRPTEFMCMWIEKQDPHWIPLTVKNMVRCYSLRYT